MRDGVGTRESSYGKPRKQHGFGNYSLTYHRVSHFLQNANGFDFETIATQLMFCQRSTPQFLPHHPHHIRFVSLGKVPGIRDTYRASDHSRELHPIVDAKGANASGCPDRVPW
jgi:hypothetical protein